MKVPCPHCGVYVLPGEKKCEACGSDLPKLKIKTTPKRTTTPQKSNRKKLVDCKDCGGQVSKNAKTCPHCGAQTKQNPAKTGCAIFIIIIIIGVIFSAVTKDKKIEKRAVTEAEKVQLQAEQEKKRLEEYELCKQTLQCWGDKHSLKATFASQDTIERHAKHQFKWTDGWMGSKMTRFRWLDRNALTVTYIGDQIQFQNGFGAWQNMIYYCDYDPINERVLKVSMRVGRLPQSN